MPVNPGTEIEPWVNTFNPDFYTSLTDKEDWTYTNYAGKMQPLSLIGLRSREIFRYWITLINPGLLEH